MLVVLVSAGWSWLLSPCGVAVGLAVLELRLVVVVVLLALLPGTLRPGCGWILYEYTYVCSWISPSAKLARS